jgi:hypothetical protein
VLGAAPVIHLTLRGLRPKTFPAVLACPALGRVPALNLYFDASGGAVRRVVALARRALPATAIKVYERDRG